MTVFKSYIVLALCLCGFSVVSAQTDTLRLSFPDVIGKRGVTYIVPLKNIDSLTVADSLLAGEMTVIAGESVYDVVGFQKSGTLLDSVSSVFFNALTGKLTFAHTKPITGKGVLIYFQLKIRTNANGSDPLSVQNILLNEGNITGIITDGSIRPMDIFINPKNPPQDRIVGDTIQFTVTGDVNLPVTWSVGDTHIVSINAAGRVIGKNVGQTNIAVIDNNGLTDQSLLLPIHPPTLRSLTVTIPDLSVMQNLTFLMPIKVSTVTGLNITSAQFRLSYNASLLIPLGVLKAGSMSSSWTEPTVLYGSNYLDVAMAGTQALADSGTLVFVRFKVKRFANFSSTVNLSSVLFNENLNATIKNGLFTPIPGPTITISGKPTDMITGETASLSASGGTAPYRWKIISDTSVASIDSLSGVMTAKKRGFASYTAIDVNGFDGFDSVLVSDVRFQFPDTSFVYTDSIDYPISVSMLTGKSIIAAQCVIPYDTNKMKFVSVIRTGLITKDMVMEVKDSAGVRIALSGVSPLSGAGKFMALRFKSKGLLSLGHTQSMGFLQVMLNESGTAFRSSTQKTGNLAITNVPNFPPVFTVKLRDTTINENQLLQKQITATDANGDSLLYGIFSGSTGMSMTGKGFFSWQPGFTQAGTHKVVYEVGDFHSDGVTRDSAVITVLNVNRNPQFTKIIPDTTIGEGIAFSYDVDATDPDGSPVRFGLLNELQGMKIDSITGLFSWTPTFAQSGVHDVVIRAFDGTGGIAVHEVILTVTNVNILPVFTQFFTDTTILENQLLTFTVKATDADGDVVHYYIQNIQPGMDIDTNTGFISWRPSFTQSGVYNISFVANDGKGGFTNKPATISVVNVNRPPVFTGSLPDTVNFVTGQTINIQFTGTDPDNNSITFAKVEGPAGTLVSVSGMFSWGPTVGQIGVHRLIVSLSDGSLSVLDTLYLRVISGNTPPRYTRTLPDTSISEGQYLSFLYAAQDAELDSLEWRMAGTPPFGIKISPAGLLEWTPGYQQAGTYHIVVSMSDKQFSFLDSSVVVVTNTNRPPQITKTLRDTSIYVDSLFTFAYSGNDIDEDSLTFSLLKQPTGASITPAGLFSWKPTQVRRDTVIVSLSDGKASALDTAILTVSGFPKLAASAFEIDFGTTIFGSLPVKQAVIKNSGTVPLLLSRITGLPNEQHFSTNAAAQITIDPEKEVIILFTFTPQQIGSHTSYVAFQTNDPKQQYFGFMMKGTAISVSAVSRRLLVDLSHSPAIALRDLLEGMTQLFGALKKSGIDVAFAETTFTPAGYDAVLLVTPQRAYTAAEKSTLQQFIFNGGLAVLMDRAAPESNNSVLNEILRDSAFAGGMEFLRTAVIDSTHNYLGNPHAPMITQFVDKKHPYLNGVDSLVVFSSAMVMTDSTAIPFATATTPSKGVVMPGFTSSVIGLKKIGKGSLVVIGNTAMWQNVPEENEQVPFNIAAKDNFTFALNLFSIDEDYIVAMPEKTPNEVYQLISIPLELKEADILPLLKASLGEINPLKWRLFGKYDPVSEKYREFPSAGFTTFTRGDAYWLITRGQFSLNFGNAVILPAQDYFPVKLGPGWTMIGNPFPYPVSWKNSRKGETVENVAWRFDPLVNDFAPESLSLAPYAGYFVKNISKDTVTIFINPMKEQLPKQTTDRTYAEREWRIKIKASSGKATDGENYAGVAPGAKDERDLFDISEPPTTPTEYLRVRFTNPQWKQHQGSYAVDIRSVTKEGLFWEFDVSAAKPQSKIRLTFDQFGTLPIDFGLYLVDKVTERVTRFDRSYFYDFTMGKGQSRHQFRLVAGTQDYVEKNTNGIPLTAMEFELRQNYPNPFNPATAIYYSIGHSGNVMLEVFNVLGQRVRLLRNETQQIGSYTIDWDGKDDIGEAVSTGVYFYKITVTSSSEKLYTNTKKMILMK